MADLVLGESGAERSAGERRPVVGPERQLARTDPPLADGSVEDGGRLGGTAADVERPADDLAGAAVDRGVQVAPAVLGDPDAGHVEVPELVGAGDLEVAGPPPTALSALGLQQGVLAHQPLHPLA